MYKISCFADEISPNLHEEISLMNELGIKYIALRSVWDKFMIDLDIKALREIKNELSKNNVQVSSIGSHVGKSSILDPFDVELDKFKHMLEIASYMDAPLMRIFSFYTPDRNHTPYQDDVIGRLEQMVELAEKAKVILVHENEKKLFGESSENFKLLLSRINSPYFKACFDPSNFVHVNEDIIQTCLPRLDKEILDVHIKDYDRKVGKTMLAGKGEGQIPELLKQLINKKELFLTLEPHLLHGQSHRGFTGPELFAAHYHALTSMLEDMNVVYV